MGQGGVAPGRVGHLGHFDTAEEAAEVAAAKRRELYPVPGYLGGQ